jgi:hypothetical protein
MTRKTNPADKLSKEGQRQFARLRGVVEGDTKNDDSYVSVGEGHMTFAGRDAVLLFAATTMRGAIDLYLKTGMKAGRLYTPTNMREAAGRVTGKHYKRNELALARDDLTTWIEAMKAALPVIDREAGR